MNWYRNQKGEGFEYHLLALEIAITLIIVTVKPISNVKLLVAVGFQWRQTTADAVYVQPNTPVSGTAGMAGRGVYGQIRGEWTITPNLSGFIETVRYWVGDVIRRAGGHDSQYVGVQLQFGW